MNVHARPIDGAARKPILIDRSVDMNGRALTIDAARGCAMLLVCFSHFGITYFAPVGALTHAYFVMYLALPATAMFIMLSGLTLGFLRQSSAERFNQQRLKFVDRGLFLLLPAHFIILAAHNWVGLSIGPDTHWLFITDAIGVCLVLGPFLVAGASSGARVAIGVALITFSWGLYFGWSPVAHFAQLCKAILVGEWSKGAVFALVPWLGAFLIATSIGEQFALRRREDRLRFLGGMAVSCLLVGAIAHLLSHGQSGWLSHVLSAGQKYPPSPAHIVASFGVGLAMLAVLEIASELRVARGALLAAAVLGRSSLFVFILQYYVYYVAFFLLKLPMSELWPLYYSGSIVLLYVAARLWELKCGNVYFTVGLKSRAFARVPIFQRLAKTRRRRLSTQGSS